MSTITEQEIFDKVWNHFVVNKASPSVEKEMRELARGGTRCVYGYWSRA